MKKDDEVNKNKEKVDLVNDDTTVIDLVNTFKNATGLQFIKEGVKWIATGTFMGSSDAVPGYSGGTSILLLGFYRKLILVAKSCFVPEPGITRLKALLFMVPFAIGWIVGVFGFAKLTELLAIKGMGLELLFFFSPFILFTIPVFLKAEKPKLIHKKKFVKSRRWAFFIIGFLVILGVGLYTKLATEGLDFSKHSSNNNLFVLSDNANWLKLIAVAFGAGMITLIPGGSGALIQFLSRMYEDIHWTIMAHADKNFGALCIFAIFTFLGMLSMVFIMAWGLKKYKNDLAALSFGMLLASIGVLFMVPSQSMWEWSGATATKHYIGIPIAVILGSGSGIGLNLFVSIKHTEKKLEI